MNFLDYSTLPPGIDAECSTPYGTVSGSDPFGQVHVVGSYANFPDRSFASFFDFEIGNQTLGLGEGVSATRTPVVFCTKSPHTCYSSGYNCSSSFNHFEEFGSGFACDAIGTQDLMSESPSSEQLRASVVYDNSPQRSHSLESSDSDRRFVLKRKSTVNSIQDGQEPLLKKKRGRPRRDRSNSNTLVEYTKRVPYYEVERKYRQGLNVQLERLRRAVPTLPQSEEGSGIGQPKPSKLRVIASAIEYIKNVERERDTYRSEQEKLRSLEQLNASSRGQLSAF